MARIRKLEIENFRGIRALEWHPSPGFNCLVGPGDAGKSTVLDAIDLCVGARRSSPFTDADFYRLDCDRPIAVRVTLGALPSDFLSLEAYGNFLRGYDPAGGSVEDEPGRGLETVLTVELRVEDDLEPRWSLVSDRAARAGFEKSLAWKDRIKLAPTRLSGTGGHHFGWSRGSILNKLSDERVDASAAVSRAARQARSSLGTEAGAELVKALASVRDLAVKLGVPIDGGVAAMLDARSMTFGNGIVSLHDGLGVPLHGLGLGSARLLVAGMQREAGDGSLIVLVDELEHGLEPHRIHRLLAELGSGDPGEPLQVFATTHSPVVVKELSVAQLHVARRTADGVVTLLSVASAGDVQGVVRTCPEALLSHTILVCEGATEIGFVRGLDHYRTSVNLVPVTALGVSFVDGMGDETYRRALAFQSMGYRTAVLRDRDKEPHAARSVAFQRGGGPTFAWRKNMAIEDELFDAFPDHVVDALLETAARERGDNLVGQHIGSLSAGKLTLADFRLNDSPDRLAPEKRAVLAKAAKNGGWFKSIGDMQKVAHEIVGPALPSADPTFRRVVDDAFAWMTRM